MLDIDLPLHIRPANENGARWGMGVAGIEGDEGMSSVYTLRVWAKRYCESSVLEAIVGNSSSSTFLLRWAVDLVGAKRWIWAYASISRPPRWTFTLPSPQLRTLGPYHVRYRERGQARLHPLHLDSLLCHVQKFVFVFDYNTLVSRLFSLP